MPGCPGDIYCLVTDCLPEVSCLKQPFNLAPDSVLTGGCWLGSSNLKVRLGCRPKMATPGATVDAGNVAWKPN